MQFLSSSFTEDQINQRKQTERAEKERDVMISQQLVRSTMKDVFMLRIVYLPIVQKRKKRGNKSQMSTNPGTLSYQDNHYITTLMPSFSANGIEQNQGTGDTKQC